MTEDENVWCERAHQAGVSLGFSSKKQLRVFLLPLSWMLVRHRVTPSIKFAGYHSPVPRGTVRVKCLAHECNTMSLARARTRTAQSSAS